MTSPLLSLFESLGHSLKREGRTYKTPCPFHDDKTPSLAIDPAKNLWHCFGCGAGGDGITFLEKSRNLSFGQAADLWRELTGEQPRHKKGYSMIATASLTNHDLQLFSRLQQFYVKDLAKNEKALSYLEKRGITDLETVRAFGLGYVSGSGLPKLNESQENRLKELGILNNQGNETLYGCLVCPLYDESGQVVSFWGRRILPGSNPHRALSGSRRGFIHPQGAKNGSVTLVEGFLDAIACFQAGVRNVIPVGGATTVDRSLLELLSKEKVREVVLALDPDEAGDQGAELWAQALQQRGIGSKRLKLDYDPAEFFRRGGTAALFRELASRAEVLARGSEEPEFLLDSQGLLYRTRTCGRPTQGKLKVQILVSSSQESRGHRDILNLYTHKSRKTFANACSQLFGLASEAIEEDLLKILEGLEQRARQQADAKEKKEAPVMSSEEQEEARQFLESPNLVELLEKDMEAMGYIGEEEAKLLVYLIATSRKLPRPLSGIVGSGSGAGKSFIVELNEQLMPPEDVVLFSKLSPQALYYLPVDYLYRKLLVLEERVGGEGADYAIRTLQTKDTLRQGVVIKDPVTGRMSTKEYEVKGPIAYLETTTSTSLNQENTSRCFEIPLDESSEQTKRIHQHQRRNRSLNGLNKVLSRDCIRRKHHNAQRLLEEVRVVIPYAEELVFPDRYLRTRRDHERFLSLIEVVAFLHQFQRKRRQTTVQGKQVAYIEATPEDYAVAYRLALKVLWVSLDELSRWARELVEWMKEQADGHKAPGHVSWMRRDLRETLNWPDRRLREALSELVEMEYLHQKRGTPGNVFHYSLTEQTLAARGRRLGLLTPEELFAKIA